MADLSNKLQDYLSKSSKSSNGSSNGGSSSSGSYFNYFKNDTGNNSSQGFPEDTTNSWFSDAQKDPCLPSLTKKQRVIGFIGCLLMGTFCFSLASLYIPFLILKARKFAMLYSLGSLFIISRCPINGLFGGRRIWCLFLLAWIFALLWGPTNHFKHLLSGERLPFTTTYFGTMIATIYFAVWVKSTIFTVVFAVLQIVALVWYIISYIPGGKTGISFFTRIFYSAASKTASKTLPV